MDNPALDVRRIHDENAVLRNILEGTATATGEPFFRALVESLANTLQTHSAWVTEYVPEKRQLHALAFWADGQVYENFFIDVDGTPCQKVIETTEIVHYPNNVLRLYPQSTTFKEFRAISYLGIPLLDHAGRVLGNLAVFDTRPMPQEPQLLVIVVGDVTGHGAEAALLMTSARAIFRLEALQADGIAEIITAMNRQLAIDVLDSGRFMTLFCLRLDSRNKSPQWIRAGHTPALLYLPEEDRFEELKGEGLALGVDGDYRYRSHRAREIAAGHIIAIGTDGIWEAFDHNGKQYGMRGFRNAIRRNAHKDAADLVDAVYADLQRFAYGTRREDDISLVIVKAAQDKPISMDWSI